MDADKSSGGGDKDDRIRILEFQVDQLRRELEFLKKRHEEAIYSVAWHVGWPVRVVERAIRRMLAGRDDDDGNGGASGAGRPRAPDSTPPQPLTRDRIAARIAQRVARQA